MAKKIHYNIDSVVEQLRCVLDDNGINIQEESSIEYGFQIRTDDNAIINFYTTGRYHICGNLIATKRVKKALNGFNAKKWLEL